MSETFWAIKGRYGFYTGTWLTRGEAIAAHIHMIDAALPPFYIREGGLTEAQRVTWNLRRSQGDRAVKVRVEEVA